MSAPIHLLPEVQSPPTIEERRVRALERAVERLNWRGKALAWVVAAIGAVTVLMLLEVI